MNLRDSKEADQALKFYISFYQNKWAFLNDGDWPYYGEYDTLLDRFKNGKVAMILGGNTMFFILKEMGAPVKVVELPSGPAGKATIAYTVGYGLMTQSSASGGPAVELLKFATSKEAMRIWIGEDKLPQGPSAPPVYMPPRISLRGNWMEAHPDAQAFLLGVDYAQPYQPAVTSAAKIAQFDQFASSIMNQVIQGNISVSEALNAIQTEGDAYLGGLK